MKEWWRKVSRDYFTFSTVERNGIIVLCVAIFVAAFAPRLISLLQKDEPANFTKFRSEVDSFKKNLQANASSDSLEEKPSLSQLDETKQQEKNTISTIKLFSFDPNTLTSDDFRKLGLRDKLIKTILNYRSKGGKFFAKEDFKKIYGLSDKEYYRLEPYIFIPHQKRNSSDQTAKTNSESIDVQPSLLNLNKADSTQLVALPGVGPILSSRIIKFRNKLGGFYSVDQLREVYGFSPDDFDLAKEKILVNAADVRKININDVTAEELKQHPYFKPIVQPLINYREQHGNFKSLEELKNIDVITEEIYLKIIPYLEI